MTRNGESEKMGGECPIHRGPRYACPNDCPSLNGKSIGKQEQRESTEDSLAHYDRTMSEIGKAYADFQQRLSEDDNPRIDRKTREFKVVDPKNGVFVDLSVPYSRGSAHATTISARKDGGFGEINVIIYVNASGYAKAREIILPGTQREYFLGVEKDGVHVGNPEVTAWSNKFLSLRNAVLHDERVDAYVKKPENEKAAVALQRDDATPEKLREVWNAAYAGPPSMLERIFGKSKFPSNLDPGPQPNDTIYPYEAIAPLLDAVNRVLHPESKK